MSDKDNTLYPGHVDKERFAESLSEAEKGGERANGELDSSNVVYADFGGENRQAPKTTVEAGDGIGEINYADLEVKLKGLIGDTNRLVITPVDLKPTKDGDTDLWEVSPDPLDLQETDRKQGEGLRKVAMGITESRPQDT